jgi:hypothetical protein
MQTVPLRPTAVAVPARRWVRVGDAAQALSLGLVFAGLTVLTRLPLAGRYLFNWDAVQFAMGVARFDLAAHRPHPPGYFGYIMLTRALVALTGAGTDTVMVGLSITAEAATVAGVCLLARRALGEFAGIAAAVLLLTSPLFWLYGETALTYGIEPGLALLAFALVVRGVQRGDGLGWAALAIAAAGGIRPTTELFLLPLLAMGILLTWRRTGRRSLRTPLVVLAAATLAWAIPLLAMSGGPVAYVEQTALLARRVSGSSAFWSAGLGGLTLDGGAVLMGLGFSLGLLLPLTVAATVFVSLPGLDSPGARRATPHWIALLLMAWVAPALSVFVLVHIGQLAYVLFVLPAAALAAGPVLERVAVVVAGRRRHLRDRLRWALLAVCAAVNVALFVSPQQSFAAQVGNRDRHVEALLATVRGFAPDRVTLLSDPEGPGSYRLASYYLPGYVSVAVGRDRAGRAGELFANDGGAPEYDLHRFERVGPLRLPERSQALVLDPAVHDLIADPGWMEPVVLDAERGDRVWLVELDPADPPLAWGSSLYLRGSDCPCAQPVPWIRPEARPERL